MAIAPGSRFGSYEIVEPIGAGGMGEVWRAHDATLKRDVALKVLPPAFVADADRLARFQREAEILASLNHPNIAQVYGLENTDGQTAIVMELVEGATLGERIKQGPIPPDEAMAIALQVVAALEAAHARQIVHRDLKPDNVKLRDDGTVKVLDFGISKPIDPAAISGGSPVMTTPAVTQTGVILGTAAYMSPEQARGKFVDERTDVWAFGCLLFEMLTGQPAFGGEDVMLTLARVLDRATDLSSIPQTISPAVRHTIKLCLEKNPKDRLADIRDVRLALDGRLESKLSRAIESRSARALWQRALLPAASVAAGAGLMAASGLWVSPGLDPDPDPEPMPVRRFAHVITPEQGFPIFGNRFFDLSADGARFVYLTREGVYRREMDALEASLIPGTSADLPNLVIFGSTSTELYVGRDGGIERISIDGGAATTVLSGELVEFLGGISTANASPQGIILSHLGGVSLLGLESGSEPKRLLDIGQDLRADGARFLPDGETLLFAIRDWSADRADSRIVVQSLTDESPTEIVARGYYPRYLPSGHLLYVADDVVRAIAFDPNSRETRGRDEVVLSDVIMSNSGVPNYRVVGDGTMAYVPVPPALAFMRAMQSGQAAINVLAWLDQDGNSVSVPIAMPSLPQHMRVSPDGGSLAVSLQIDDDEADIYIYNLRRPGSPTRVTRDPAPEGRAIWTRDGLDLVYSNQGPDGGLFRRGANGLDPPERLTERPAEFADSVPYWISTDGSTLVFDRGGPPPGNAGLFTLNLDDQTVAPLIDDPDVREVYASVSPDERYIAYVSNQTGANEVYVRPYPDVDSGIEIVSIDGGEEPYWDPNGGYLYYISVGSASGTSLMRVPVQTEPELEIGDPEPISSVPLLGGTQLRPNYDFDPRENRFLVRTPAAASVGNVDLQEISFEIVITENWTEWLKQEVPVD